MAPSAILQFLGGAGTVTGSRFLMEVDGARVLVDCGLYQGLKKLRLRNWDPFPVAPESIDAVLLTHAHVDHSGYLPRLHKLGYRGPVFATAGTRELCEIVLRDGGRLQEEEAAYANRKGYSRHRPAEPLYTEDDADAVLTQFETVAFDRPHDVAPGVVATCRHAGHILGAARVELAIAGGPRLHFSGDLGGPGHPILSDPRPPEGADAIVIESTYGDREHSDAEALERFADAIARTADRGGVSVIPAFAVDRTELLILELRRLMEAGRIPRIPVHVDSPMALAALRVYREAIESGSFEVRPELHGRPEVLDTGTLVEVHSVGESRELQRGSDPAIVISASGMATGGRVVHHLRRRLPDPRNAVILTGYQAVGTRGRRLLEGEKAVKMLGEYVPVRAEVVDASAFSVHADREELLAWLGAALGQPAITFVVHGEPEASRALAEAIRTRLDVPAVVPTLGERVRVTG